jgi:hypothetical protein
MTGWVPALNGLLSVVCCLYVYGEWGMGCFQKVKFHPLELEPILAKAARTAP